MTTRQLKALRSLIRLCDDSHGPVTPADLWQAGGAGGLTGAGVVLSHLARQGLATCIRSPHSRRGANRYEPTEHGRRVMELEDA